MNDLITFIVDIGLVFFFVGLAIVVDTLLSCVFKEKDNSFVLSADIPGLNKKDIKINVANGRLSISGERTFETDQENDNYHYQERRFGTFDRSFNLPETVDEDNISASFKNGILSIQLPKHEVEIPKDRLIKIS